MTIVIPHWFLIAMTVLLTISSLASAARIVAKWRYERLVLEGQRQYAATIAKARDELTAALQKLQARDEVAKDEVANG